ncbi:hypothetical protein ACWIID_24950 [Streptomyces phaeochromogenes]
MEHVRDRGDPAPRRRLPGAVLPYVAHVDRRTEEHRREGPDAVEEDQGVAALAGDR